MPNHIHLLMKEGRDPVNTVFRRLGTSFVYWYNLKYERTGHLFQDRFKSEPVDDDAYFLTSLRYIHQNPVKAGLCSRAGEYPYSSYSNYFENGSIDSEFVLGLISRDDFFRYHDEKNNDNCMEVSEHTPKRLTDTKVKELMKSLCNCEYVSQFQALPESQKAEALAALLHAGGSIRQVSRLTGISFGIVRKYT